MKSTLFGLFIIFFIANPIFAETEQTWSFEQDKAGKLPSKWKIAETKGKGVHAIWEVHEDDTNGPGKKVLAITNNTNRGDMGNLLIQEESVFKEIELSTRVKATTSGKNAGGGLIWRVVDENHYYLAQWNAASNNLRLYVYIGGKPSLLESVSVEGDPKAWHHIEVSHIENMIEVLFDSEPKISVEDKQLDFKGNFGLWAQGDALPAFDDITLYSEEGEE